MATGVEFWTGLLELHAHKYPICSICLVLCPQNLFTTLSRLAKEFKPSLGLYPTSSHAIPEAAGLARLRKSIIVSAVRLRGMEAHN